MIRTKIKGSSILEVLIALGIISSCMSVGLLIYNNVQNSNPVFFKLRSIEIMEGVLRDKSIVEESNKVYEIEEFTVKIISKINPQFNDCILMQTRIYDGAGKLIQNFELIKRKRLK